MSQSLAPECTPLKHAYDSCFNDWFAGYLQPTSSSQSQSSSHEKGAADGVVDTEAKVKEYHEKCGKVWEEYQACLVVRTFLLSFLSWDAFFATLSTLTS